MLCLAPVPVVVPSPPIPVRVLPPTPRPSASSPTLFFLLDAPPEPKHEPQPPLKSEATTTNAEAAKPLAPPPRPGQQPAANNSPDYFTNPVPGGSLSLEPNPFEQSFSSGAPPETPGGTKLPSVAALTSPSSLLPGTGVTPFGWGPGSLRTGPLSPAMLSGPTNDYFSDHIRGGFPTPNESSLRTGLTPGGSGSMFPAPSPNSTLFAQLASTAATPGTIDFHRTALSAAAAKQREQAQAQAQAQVQAQPPAVSQPPQEMTNGASAPLKPEPKAPTGPFDPHDNDAANGLFMLAQGRNSQQPQPQHFAVIAPPPSQAHPAPARPVQHPSTSPQMNGGASIAGSSARGVSEAASAISEDSETARPPTRTKGKRNSAGGTSNRRKAEDTPAKGSANKKAKTNSGAPSLNGMEMDHSDDEHDMKDGEERNGGGGHGKSKMTDDEKRKNFLERNRYDSPSPVIIR